MHDGRASSGGTTASDSARPLDDFEHLGRSCRDVRVCEPEWYESRRDGLGVAPSIAIEVGNSRVPASPVELEDDAFVGEIAVDPSSATIEPSEARLDFHTRLALEPANNAVGAPLELTRGRDETLGTPVRDQRPHDSHASATSVLVERKSLVELVDCDPSRHKQVVDGALEPVDGDSRRDVEERLRRRRDRKTIDIGQSRLLVPAHHCDCTSGVSGRADDDLRTSWCETGERQKMSSGQTPECRARRTENGGPALPVKAARIRSERVHSRIEPEELARAYPCGEHLVGSAGSNELRMAERAALPSSQHLDAAVEGMVEHERHPADRV